MSETCSVCGETYNHKITNGYRNYWPGPGEDIRVCSDFDGETVYVHVVNNE